MTTVIKQITSNSNQTIRQIVTSNDRGPAGPQGIPGGTIQYSAGTGIKISDENVISATGKTSVAWGNIEGTLSDQTDLQTALNAKATTSDLATVATSGSYSDLSNKPSLATVATTGSYNDLKNKPTFATVATSGSYSDLTNKPTALDYINIVYPVGSYYETSDASFNPNVTWGGTWVEDTAGRILVASDTGTFSTIGSTGGEETHTLTTTEMPEHNHPLTLTLSNTGGGVNSVYCANFNASADGTVQTNNVVPSTGEVRWGVGNRGSGTAHNNLQPYIVIKRWHRTA